MKILKTFVMKILKDTSQLPGVGLFVSILGWLFSYSFMALADQSFRRKSLVKFVKYVSVLLNHSILKISFL